MAITEPTSGSDSAAIRTTMILDEKQAIRAQWREDLRDLAAKRAELVVVWATPGPRSMGRPARSGRSFVERLPGPGHEAGPPRAQAQGSGVGTHGPRSSSQGTAGCPRRTLLGSPDDRHQKSASSSVMAERSTTPCAARWAARGSARRGAARVSTRPREILARGRALVDRLRPSPPDVQIAATTRHAARR